MYHILDLLYKVGMCIGISTANLSNTTVITDSILKREAQ